MRIARPQTCPTNQLGRGMSEAQIQAQPSEAVKNWFTENHQSSHLHEGCWRQIGSPVVNAIDAPNIGRASTRLERLGLFQGRGQGRMDGMTRSMRCVESTFGICDQDLDTPCTQEAEGPRSICRVTWIVSIGHAGVQSLRKECRSPPAAPAVDRAFADQLHRRRLKRPPATSVPE